MTENNEFFNREKYMDYTDINAKTIDRWVDDGWEWGVPVSHEEFVDAQDGKYAARPLRRYEWERIPP